LICGIDGRAPGEWRSDRTDNRLLSQFIIGGTVNQLDKPRIEAILEFLRKYSGDVTLVIRDLREGSAKFIIDSTELGFKRLDFLFRTGQLPQVLEIPVKGITPMEIGSGGARHGMPPRGLVSTNKSPMFQGKFGRMFRALPAAKYGKDEGESLKNLAKLGSAMAADFDPPKDGKDDEESGIPALYTYFGQFIDHDITFDPASSLQKQNDPNALIVFRTPAFDLDNVYGRGPDDQPYMYDIGGKSFLLGNRINGGDPNAEDLPRNGASPARALIGDPRNDENAIVSQLQGLFLRFHNRMVADNPDLPSRMSKGLFDSTISTSC
jgi:hypothetical protein